MRDCWPLGAVLRGVASNHLMLRRSWPSVVSDEGKGGRRSPSGGDREGERERTAVDVSISNEGIRTGAWPSAPGCVNGNRNLTSWRQLNSDHFRVLGFLGCGRGDAAEVSVFEPVGVAFEGDDFGVLDEAIMAADDILGTATHRAASGAIGNASA